MRLAAVQATFVRWLHAECADAAARLGGGPGLDVYLNNYRSQLIAALESSFPQLRRWLGEAAFRAAAAQHIEAAPPRAWSLDAYGEDFADAIAALYPDDPECEELAQIEWLLAASFTTPDVAPLAIETLQAVDWEAACFRFVPSLNLLPVRTNAGALWQALASQAPPPDPQHLPTQGVILLWRNGFHPSFRTAEQAEARAIRALQTGMSFGALCAGLAGEQGEEGSAAVTGGWLGSWLRDGLIAGLS